MKRQKQSLVGFSNERAEQIFATSKFAVVLWNEMERPSEAGLPWACLILSRFSAWAIPPRFFCLTSETFSCSAVHQYLQENSDRSERTS